jgi:hypothetical protein
LDVDLKSAQSATLGSGLRWVMFTAILVAACGPVLAAPVLPTIDFYDHLNRYFVLAHLGRGTYLDLFYQSAWSLLPNIGMDVLGVWLLSWATPAVAAKTVAILIFIVQYTGVLAFAHALHGRLRLGTALLAAPLLYSFIFTWGFANFLLGLGLVFWGAAIWLWLRPRLAVATLVGAAVALAVFLTHGVAFALYGLLLLSLEFGDRLEGDGPLSAAMRRIAGLAAQAVAPCLLFLSSRTVHAAGGVTTAGQSIQRLAGAGRLIDRLAELAVYRIQTIVRVAEGPSLAGDVLLLGGTVALLAVLAARRRVFLPRATWPAIGLGVLLVGFAPPALFGVGYVSDRMPLFAALVLAGALGWREPRGRLDRVLVWGLAAAAAVRLVAVTVDYQRYARDDQNYAAVADRIPAHSVVNFINVSLEPRLGGQRRCEMFGPMLISRYGQAAALFAIPTAQPIRLKGRLAEAVEHLPPHVVAHGGQAIDYYERTLAAVLAQKDFDYSLICDAGLLRHGPPPTAVVASSGRFTLVRVRQ